MMPGSKRDSNNCCEICLRGEWIESCGEHSIQLSIMLYVLAGIVNKVAVEDVIVTYVGYIQSDLNIHPLTVFVIILLCA